MVLNTKSWSLLTVTSKSSPKEVILTSSTAYPGYGAEALYLTLPGNARGLPGKC